jgi:hypothetical protein
LGKTFKRARGTGASTTILLAAAALCSFGIGSGAGAVNINTGDPDLTIRWDNTVKYTLGMRVSGEDKQVAPGPYNNISVDDGDNNFKPGDLTTNRLDLLSEFDLDYQHRMGFRVSGAGWYDQVYNQSNSNHSPLTNNNLGGYSNSQFPNGTQVLQGRDAEVLDAFVYRNFSMDNGQNASVRFGRHSVLWGESLFWGGNAIAGTQQPVDVIKASALPGAQFKEIIMPVGQASVLWQISNKVSFGGFFQFEDRKERDPTVGSYFAFADFYAAGGNNLLVAPGTYFGRLKDFDKYSHNQGGAELRWKASDNWELGLYAVNYDSRSPKFYLQPGLYAGPQSDGDFRIGSYQAFYGQNIHAYAASFATLVGDTNVSGEFGVHTNQPLASGTGDFIVGGPGAPIAMGDTFHGNVSAITLFPASPLWEGAALVGEVAYNYRMDVNNKALLDPNVTAGAWAAWMNFEPSYFQVMPGLDITLPINVTYVFGGRSSLGPSIFNFIGENSGSVTFGVHGTYHDRYKISLDYTNFFGKPGPFATGPDNHYSYLQQWADRDYVALSLSTSF